MLSLPLDVVNGYFRAMFEFISLDQPVYNDDEFTVGDFIAQTEGFENDIFKEALKEDINELFKILDEKELKVIKMRFGLEEYENRSMSIKEISKEMSLLSQRIINIEKKALMKIRAYCQRDEKSGSLRDYMR